MARPRKSHPTATLLQRGNKQAIRWTRDRIVYQLAASDDPITAAREMAEVNLALVSGKWPDWSIDLPTVRRFIASPGSRSIMDNDIVFARFTEWAKTNLTPKYVETYLFRVRELAQFSAPTTLTEITRLDAIAYLDWIRSSPTASIGTTKRIIETISHDKPYRIQEIAKLLFGENYSQNEYNRTRSMLKYRNDLFERISRGTYKLRETQNGNGRSPATRNRALSILRVFYTWAHGQSLVRENPFSGISDLPEGLPDEIVWCDREERDRIIAVAMELGFDLPVVIAFYSGLRFGEIARLRWQDVNLVSGWIAVGRDQATRTKTGRARQVPIGEVLKKRLLDIPEKQRRGTVCKFREDPYLDRDTILTALKKRLPELAGKIGFNPWRHTFCSLLAQTGRVSIDQIAAISGHTPEVCRRHYAHLIPRDKNAIGIDLL